MKELPIYSVDKVPSTAEEWVEIDKDGTRWHMIGLPPQVCTLDASFNPDFIQLINFISE
jgi:hypothetical protein